MDAPRRLCSMLVVALLGCVLGVPRPSSCQTWWCDRCLVYDETPYGSVNDNDHTPDLGEVGILLPPRRYGCGDTGYLITFPPYPNLDWSPTEKKEFAEALNNSIYSGVGADCLPGVACIGLVYVSEATKQYNCHSYAWRMYDKMVCWSNNPKAIDPDVHWQASEPKGCINELRGEGGYVKYFCSNWAPKVEIAAHGFWEWTHYWNRTLSSETAIGARIVYNIEGATPQFKAAWQHSGILNGGYYHGAEQLHDGEDRPMVVSKWGQGPLYFHQYWNCPYFRNIYPTAPYLGWSRVEEDGPHYLAVYMTPASPPSLIDEFALSSGRSYFRCTQKAGPPTAWRRTLRRQVAPIATVPCEPDSSLRPSW